MKKQRTKIECMLEEAKSLAKKYKKLTGRPLGITGEVGEFAAAKLLGLKIAEVRQSGYDATRRKKGMEEKIQIKSRSFSGNGESGRLGQIRLDKKWDVVMMVLMDEDMEVTSIYEANKSEIRKALKKPGSKARNENGALSIGKFKSIGRQVWP